MVQQRLQHWIEHPEELGTESLYELRQLLVQYPFFQTARILYLKNLYLLRDSSFKDELRKGGFVCSRFEHPVFMLLKGISLSLTGM